MQAVALILALAVFTGCNARAVRQASDPADRWVSTVDNFWRYISELNQKADEVLVNMKDSQLRRELDTLITDTMDELSVYKDDVQNKLAPFTQASATQMTEDMKLLFNKLHNDMVEARDRNIAYVGELKAMVETNTGSVRDHLNLYTNKLRKRLNKDTAEIKETAGIYMGEIQSRATQNLQSMRDVVEPYVQQVGDTGSKKLSDISSFLMSRGDGLSEQLQAQAEGIKAQLELNAEQLRISLEAKMNELKDALSPLTVKLREQVESIVDKVTETTSS